MGQGVKLSKVFQILGKFTILLECGHMQTRKHMQTVVKALKGTYWALQCQPKLCTDCSRALWMSGVYGLRAVLS